jgi:hypothetical protein
MGSPITNTIHVFMGAGPEIGHDSNLQANEDFNIFLSCLTRTIVTQPESSSYPEASFMSGSPKHSQKASLHSL